MALPAALAGMVLGRILSWVFAALLFKIIAALGIGFAVMTGVDVLIDGLFAEVQAVTSGLPANLLTGLRILRIDDAITVIFGAISIRVALKTFGVAGGSIKQLVFGAPAGGGG